MSSSPLDLPLDRSINVKLVIADHAQMADGKVFISGGAWTDMRWPTPFAVVAIFEVPWSQTNKKHSFRLAMIDQDGHDVQVETDAGFEELAMEGEFEVGRPPGVPSGTSFITAVVWKLAPFPFAAGAYEFRMLIDGDSHDEWRIPFRFHDEQPNAQAA